MTTTLLLDGLTLTPENLVLLGYGVPFPRFVADMKTTDGAQHAWI
jgi:hypothetical protein